MTEDTRDAVEDLITEALDRVDAARRLLASDPSLRWLSDRYADPFAAAWDALSTITEAMGYDQPIVDDDDGTLT